MGPRIMIERIYVFLISCRNESPSFLAIWECQQVIKSHPFPANVAWRHFGMAIGSWFMTFKCVALMELKETDGFLFYYFGYVLDIRNGDSNSGILSKKTVKYLEQIWAGSHSLFRHSFVPSYTFFVRVAGTMDLVSKLGASFLRHLSVGAKL